MLHRTLGYALLILTGCHAPQPHAAPSPAPAAAGAAVPPACAVQLLVDGRPLAFCDPQVLSIDDANRTYQVTLCSTALAEGVSVLAPVLVVGNLQFAAPSWGRSGATSDFIFHASPAEARTIAAALGVPAREREAWPIELTGTLETVGAPRAGDEHLPLRFTLTNRGRQALWFHDGGHGRNELGRDNRFTFAIERDGEAVPTRELVDFGGLGRFREIAPDASCVLELDLAQWCALERPGRYSVHAKYAADLMPAEFEPGRSYPPGWYAHLQRTRMLEAELAFELR